MMPSLAREWLQSEIRASDLAATRAGHVETFLASRGIEPERLERDMRRRLGRAGTLLLTSSPVHGLANETSDLDFIHVQDDAIEGERISTKVFDGTHHLEVVSFSGEEVESAFAHLRRLAQGSPESIVAGVTSWDALREPRRKQTERIVNGVTLSGSAPYLEHLGTLSRVWACASLHTAIEQIVYMALAEAAGELRGRVGYAVNGLLYLMDAVLSRTGDVYTTRKWYLLRWNRFARTLQQNGERDPMVEGIESLRDGVTCALRGSRGSLVLEYVTVASAVAAAMGGIGRTQIELTLDADARILPFLPHASLRLRDAAGALVETGGSPQPIGPMDLSGLAGLGHDQSAWLRLLRADTARLLISHSGAGAE